MRKVYVVIFLCVLLPLITKAQTPAISVYYLENSCLGSTQKISFYLYGEVQSDNQFTVQIREDEGNYQILKELPATLRNGKMEVSYDDSSLPENTYLQLRIVASSPKTESNWYSFRLFSKGTVSLVSKGSDTINIGDNLNLKFAVNSSTEVWITMNDSSRINGSSGGQSYILNSGISTFKTDEFYIVHAENACGAMQVSGRAKAVVNPIAIRTTGISPLNMCEDSEVKIAFSTFGNALPANAKFRVRFLEGFNSGNGLSRSAEVAAELKGGFVVARFPKGFKLRSRTEFGAVVLVDNPQIVGAAGDAIIKVNPYPSAKFYTQSSSINVGDKLQIGVEFSGLPPYSADLGNGLILNTTFNGQNYFDVQPGKTTTYSVKSLSTGCGPVTVDDSQTLVATVRDGIYLSSDDNPKILCANTPVRLKIKSSGPFTEATRYQVQANFFDNTRMVFEATRKGDELEVNFTTAGNLSLDHLNYLQVVSTNPSFSSPLAFDFRIQSVPVMTLSPYNSYDYDTPGYKYLSYNVTGEGPYTLVDQDNKISTAYGFGYPTEVFVTKAADFKYKSIANSCYSNSNLPTAHFTIGKTITPGFLIKAFSPAICNTDSLEIALVQWGVFGTGNIFNIQASIDGRDFKTVRSVSTAGTYKIMIPPSASKSAGAKVRIVSTMPVISSGDYLPQIQYLPEQILVSPMSTQRQPAQFLKGEDIQLQVYGSASGIRSFLYSDGAADHTASFEPEYNASVKITPPAGKVTTYTVKSVTNLCGTVKTNISSYIRVLPYRILISEDDFYNSRFCAGALLTANFQVLQGEAGNAAFSIEVAKQDSLDFSKWPGTANGKTITTTIPANLAAGTYQMRITSSDGAISNVVRFQVDTAPTAKISTNLPQPLLVDAGLATPLKLDFTGTSPWNVVYENNSSQYTEFNPTFRSIIPTASGEFSLKTVYNRCGYGTAAGKVAVTVKPRLVMSTTSTGICEGASFSLTYDLQGEADLSGDYIRFELLDIVSKKFVTLDSTRTRSGSLTLRIPSGLTGSSYQIRGVIRSYALVSVLNVVITTKADLTLSGNTVINSGESASIIIRNNKGYFETKYALSDGSTGTVYAVINQHDTYITVKPLVTTTYTITSASNACGVGKTSGSATVEVNPPSERTLSVSGLYSLSSAAICTGDTVAVYYDQKGSFSSSNKLTVQLSDTTGKNFRDIVTVGNVPPLKAVLPTDVFAEKNYRIRIIASDAGTASGAYQFPFTASRKPTARFASETVSYDGITDPKVIVLLEGGNGWDYQYEADSGFMQSRSTSSSSDTITFFQALPGQFFKLISVSNVCGNGKVNSPSIVRVEVITGEPVETARIIVAPNPAHDYLFIRFDAALPRMLRLYDMRGTTLRNWSSTSEEENMDIRSLSPGIYILQIENKGKKATYKIVKQ